MNDNPPLIAKVVEVKEHDPVELIDGAVTILTTAVAKMYAPLLKYSSDLFMIKILKPEKFCDLQIEGDHLMEYGEFQFSTTNKVKAGDALEISITPIGP
jgi:hypothetical protein